MFRTKALSLILFAATVFARAQQTPIQLAFEDPGQDFAAQAGGTTQAAPPKDNGFFHRLGRAYAADWAGTAPSTAVPQEARRGTPGPIFSPPYPATDWPIGGTVVIGAPDGQSYPLMQAIDENKGIDKIYGWIEVGGNGSTNNKTNASKGIAANVPAATSTKTDGAVTTA